jgi:hypothetical protein
MRKFLRQLPLKVYNEYWKKEYLVKYANKTGGKAGKGHNKTSTVQVLYNHVIMKHIRYNVNDHESLMKALLKAMTYCVGPKEAEKYFFEHKIEQNESAV